MEFSAAISGPLRLAFLDSYFTGVAKPVLSLFFLIVLADFQNQKMVKLFAVLEEFSPSHPTFFCVCVLGGGGGGECLLILRK